jgi:hypothetical protein
MLHENILHSDRQRPCITRIPKKEIKIDNILAEPCSQKVEAHKLPAHFHLALDVVHLRACCALSAESSEIHWAFSKA